MTSSFERPIKTGLWHVLFLLLACVAPFLASFRAYGIIDINLQMQLGNPSGAIVDPSNTNHYLVQHTVEAFDFSNALGEPVWVSWDLTTADVGSAQRQDDYRPDPNLPANFYAVTDGDYNGVGAINFNRGHMCPSEDRTDNTNDNSMLFFMDNIIPQAATNNQGVWGTFEGYCRTQASSGNELLIICGPSGFGTNRIPSGKAVIPNYTWKIVVVVPLGASNAVARITPANRVISLRIPNVNTVNPNWQVYVTNAAAIEADTGFSFFTALPPNVATVFRNVIDGQTPPAPSITGFSPSAGATNSTVTITGTNFVFATNVTFNGKTATFTINSSTSITATVPTNATTGPIKVAGLGGSVTTSSNFTINGSTTPDFAIQMSHPGNFSAGDVGDTYTIIVTNVGNGASSNSVTVTDILPSGLTATAISGTGWTTNLGALTATRSDTLAAGSAYPPITVTVNVATNALATVTNTATVANSGDNNSANNTVNDVTTINALPAPDLTVIAFHSGNFTQGDSADTYTLIVTNVGSATSSGTVTLTDTLPSGLTATAISGSGWTTNLGTLTCTRSDTLATGSAYPAVTITVSVASNAPTSVVNSVTVSGGNDNNAANNTVTDPTTINALSTGTATNVVISQVYGGGGNANATYQNDFVELFNPLPVAVNLSTWSVQYASAAGSSWSGNQVNLTGSIQPHHYYLIKMFANSTNGATLPASDAANTNINMSGSTGGKVALVSSQTSLTAVNPVGTAGVVDFVGYGTANAFEGTGAASAPPANVSSVLRKNGGYSDSNNNTNDFTLAAPPTPRNSSSPANDPAGSADLAIGLAHTGNFTQGDTNDTYTITVTNTGAAASSGSVSVVDSLPAGLTATAINGSGWTATLGTLTCTRSDSLAIGASFPPITITVSVAANAAAIVTNSATVSGGGETNSANNTASNPTTIIALSPIQAWRQQYFGITSNSGLAADTAVASSDGFPNLMKYAWGFNPLVPTNSPVVGDISTGFLRLTSPKNPNATDITYHVEVSSTLTNGWTINGTTTNQNTSTLLRVQDNTAINNASQKFIRLRVTDP